MALTKLTENLNVHQTLPDKPNLASDELKKTFDSAANKIKEYINEILTEQLDEKINSMENITETIQSTVKKNADILSTKQLDIIYPIGSIYMSINNNDPSGLFGGTWESWGAGRVPVGVDTLQSEFDTVEEIGGAKTVTLTTEQMPSHDHTPNSNDENMFLRTNGNIAVNSTLRTFPSSTDGTHHLVYTDDPNISITETSATSRAGSGQAHNNLQPYITCYMWKRVA